MSFAPNCAYHRKYAICLLGQRPGLRYDRFDKPSLVDLMNDLYRNEWRTFQNFFCLTLKLKEKQRINSKYIKKYHPPRTPCQRLLESDHVTFSIGNAIAPTESVTT